MLIQNIDDLPDFATRCEWCELLDCSDKTLARAEKKGLLRASRPNRRTVIYAKDTIINYFLGN